MTAYGLPFFFEDTTGLETGPTDFLDIYDRPPFLRISTSHPHPSYQPSSSISRGGGESTLEGRTVKIYEMGSRRLYKSSSRRYREEGATPPCAVLSLDAGGRGLVGSIRLYNGKGLALERWLKKSTTFGSTLTRQFKGSDGMYYQWSFRTVDNHEWACVQLGSNYLVAHYDVRPPGSPKYETSGNVLTVYQAFTHISVELLASLVVMRHIRTSQ